MNKIDYHKLLIADYLSKRNNMCCIDIITYIIEQNSLEAVIRVAVMSKNKNGKTESHQRRIYKDVYPNFLKNLLNVKDKIKNTRNFDELINIIFSNKPSGVGDLFCYDVALRIGYKLNKLPEKIYIHAGTKIGLEKLLKRKIYEKTIEKRKLPEPFCSCELTSDQLEDFFCIYKKYLSDNNLGYKEKKLC
jgi:hypothetical protein